MVSFRFFARGFLLCSVVYWLFIGCLFICPSITITSREEQTRWLNSRENNGDSPIYWALREKPRFEMQFFRLK